MTRCTVVPSSSALPSLIWLKWQKRSSPPSLGEMNPKPFSLFHRRTWLGVGFGLGLGLGGRVRVRARLMVRLRLMLRLRLELRLRIRVQRVRVERVKRRTA